MMAVWSGWMGSRSARFAEFIAPSRLGRSFRWLLASSWVTNLGDGITLAALPPAASRTHDPLAVAMAALLQRLPWLLFGLYAGVVADRLNRRAIVITTGLVRAAILLLLTAAILTRRADVAVILAALFLFGVNETFGDTTTTTLLPMLVGKPDLGIANSRALTGVIVWNQLAACWLALCCSRLDAVAVRQRTGARAGRRAAGARQVRPPLPRRPRTSCPGARGHPRRMALAMGTRRGADAGDHDFHVQRHLRRRLVGAGPVRTRAAGYGRSLGFGLITTAMAAGGLIGAMCYGWLERHVRLGVIMRGGLIIETLTYLALALVRWAWLALIVFAILGAHAFIWATTSAAVRQRAVPARFQGRVGSVYLIGVVGGIVIGSALGGLVASVWGITAPFWFAFVGSAIILAAIWRSLLQIAHADEHARESSPAASA